MTKTQADTCKYETGQACVTALRAQLDTLTERLETGLFFGKVMRPMQRKKTDDQADAVATCIELLVLGGNYSTERAESLQRVRGRV